MFEGFKTFLGIAIAFAPTVATMFGYHTSPSFTGDATQIASAVVALAGSALAVYGRLVAAAPGFFAKN